MASTIIWGLLHPRRKHSQTTNTTTEVQHPFKSAHFTFSSFTGLLNKDCRFCFLFWIPLLFCSKSTTETWLESFPSQMWFSDRYWNTLMRVLSTTCCMNRDGSMNTCFASLSKCNAVEWLFCWHRSIVIAKHAVEDSASSLNKLFRLVQPCNKYEPRTTFFNRTTHGGTVQCYPVFNTGGGEIKDKPCNIETLMKSTQNCFLHHGGRNQTVILRVLILNVYNLIM